MAAKAKTKSKTTKSSNGDRRAWDNEDVKYLKTNFRKLPVSEIAKKLKRAEGAVRQKAFALGVHKRAA